MATSSDMLLGTLYFAFISAIILPAALHVQGQLTPNFYDEVCPQALPTIQVIVETAVTFQPRIGASLVRLHFHDCFVNVRQQAEYLNSRMCVWGNCVIVRWLCAGLRWFGVVG